MSPEAYATLLRAFNSPDGVTVSVNGVELARGRITGVGNDYAQVWCADRVHFTLRGSTFTFEVENPPEEMP